MSILLSSHDIYFVCKGTSSNDIINSVNKTFKEKKQSLMNFFWGKKPNNSNISNKQKKIELDDFSPLEDIGIKEMYLSKDSDNIIRQTNTNNIHIYTSLDLSAIESALILSQNKINQVHPITITPLPYMSTDKKINSKNLRAFIDRFGILNRTITNSRLYWDTKKSHFLNISEIHPIINWNKILDNDKNLTSHNIDKFKNIFKESFLENHNNLNDICVGPLPRNKILHGPLQRPLKVPIIIADYELISKLLRNISIKDSRLYEIERGSIWKISIDIIFTYNGTNIIKKDIKYKKFVKKYPTEYNYEPLTFINNKTFNFDHNTMTYTLFNAKNVIPLIFLNGMTFYRLSPEKQLAIKKAIEIAEKTNKSSNKSLNKLTNNINSLNNNSNKSPEQSFKFD